MGWKGKFVFLLIVYFAGFATAVYYLAPQGPGENNNGVSASFTNSSDKDYAAAFVNIRQKVAAEFKGIDTQKYKDAFNRSMAKLLEMAKNSQIAAANGQSTSGGGEEK
ncbi:MAG: hypothetical protein ABR969_06325 [Sedimentisphaerales bacterium]